MENNNQKYITLCFVGAGALVYYVVGVLGDTLARSFGFFAKYSGSFALEHGAPVAFGILTFAFLQFNKRTVAWADDVLSEVLKVVWPSKKDTVSMTIVVSIMLVISGIVLGAFDYISHLLVSYILG
jgi:preprotein translocase SecE subunit